jgi:hypothetical protein
MKLRQVFGICVALFTWILSPGVSAQSCKSGEKLTTNCVELKGKYPLTEVFFFSQQNGTIYQYHNSCAADITLVVTLVAGARSLEMQVVPLSQVVLAESNSAI